MLLGKIHKFKEKLASLSMSMKLSVTRLTEFEKYGVECIYLEVKLQKPSPVLVGFLYRNHSEPANWTDKFVSMMDIVRLESPPNYCNG